MKVDLKDLNAALDNENGLENLNNNVDDDVPSQTPFEGPEKLLEVWFAPCYSSLKCDDLVRRQKPGWC